MLAESGRDYPAELRRIRSAVTELPRVEVLAVAAPRRIATGLPGELVDWLDSSRILLLQAGQLVVLDVDTGARTPTRIRAAGVRQVFVR